MRLIARCGKQPEFTVGYNNIIFGTASIESYWTYRANHKGYSYIAIGQYIIFILYTYDIAIYNSYYINYIIILK